MTIPLQRILPALPLKTHRQRFTSISTTYPSLDKESSLFNITSMERGIAAIIFVLTLARGQPLQVFSLGCSDATETYLTALVGIRLNGYPQALRNISIHGCDNSPIMATFFRNGIVELNDKDYQVVAELTGETPPSSFFHALSGVPEAVRNLKGTYPRIPLSQPGYTWHRVDSKLRDMIRLAEADAETFLSQCLPSSACVNLFLLRNIGPALGTEKAQRLVDQVARYSKPGDFVITGSQEDALAPQKAADLASQVLAFYQTLQIPEIEAIQRLRALRDEMQRRSSIHGFVDLHGMLRQRGFHTAPYDWLVAHDFKEIDQQIWQKDRIPMQAGNK